MKSSKAFSASWSERKKLLFLDIRSRVTRQQMDAFGTSERMNEYCACMADKAIGQGFTVVTDEFLAQMDMPSNAIN